MFDAEREIYTCYCGAVYLGEDCFFFESNFLIGSGPIADSKFSFLISM